MYVLNFNLLLFIYPESPDALSYTCKATNAIRDVPLDFQGREVLKRKKKKNNNLTHYISEKKITLPNPINNVQYT